MTVSISDRPERRTLLELYRCMVLIRAFEMRVAELYKAREIPGFVHVSIGQEAVAAGVCGALGRADYMTTTHRGHGHTLAKGADPAAMMAELYGKADGLCGGKGGSMHLADPALGVLGANAIVGAGLPLAVGGAWAAHLRGEDRVAVAFFGEGAANQGMFHEALNLAAVWDVPVLFACENNLYAEFTESSTMTRVPSVAERARAHGVPGAIVDGNDVEAVHSAAWDAVARCRRGEGPVLLECETYRWRGHHEGDPQAYKPEGEPAEWRRRDPLARAEAALLGGSGRPQELEEARSRAGTVVDAAVERARAAPEPDAGALETQARVG